MRRRMPVVDDEVVAVFLGVREEGVIVAVEDGGRSVTVATETERSLRFALDATGHFVTSDRSARMAWPAPGR